MKSFLASTLVLFCAIQASAECVDGHREKISPTYTVEYKCGVYRQGEMRSDVSSEIACATLCEDGGRSICSYHLPTKRCIIGNPDGKDITRADVIYMTKIEEPPEDPFEEEDPFAEDCKGEKDACLKREATSKAELAKCRADAASALPREPSEPVCQYTSIYFHLRKQRFNSN